MLRLDTEIFRGINGLAGHYPWLDALGIFSAKYLIWVMAGIILAGAVVAERQLAARQDRGWWSRLTGSLFRRRTEERPDLRAVAAVRGVLAALAADLGNSLFSLFYFRARPCGVLYQVNNLLHRSCVDKSFPSDHSSMAFALAFSAVFVRPLLGSALLVMAGFVAWGRVFVGVHYPADVLAGAAVGLFWALAARAAESRFGLTGRLQRLFWTGLKRGKA